MKCSLITNFILLISLYHIISNTPFCQIVHGIFLKKIPKRILFVHSQNPNLLIRKNKIANKIKAKVQCENMENHKEDYVKPSLQIAPMLDVTYLQFRQFMRLLTKKTHLWTEMFTATALVHAPQDLSSKWLSKLEPDKDILEFDPNEHPIVAQLGGNCVETLIEAGRLIKDFGYDEINLNVGCPSPRVSGKGCFGAYLMKEKELVRDIVTEMRKKLELNVTVKTRLGVDECDSYDFLKDFISTVSQSGCDHFIIHSRKAWLKGVNPKQNRSVPPLQYEKVYRLQQDFPDLKFTINGGFKTMEDILGALNSENLDNNKNSHKLNGVMIGRLAYENPCLLANADKVIYGVENPKTCSTRRILLENYAKYIDETEEENEGMNIAMIVKPILGVFHGEQGSKTYRQSLSNTYNYDDFTYHTGMTKHSMFIHQAIDLMDKVNPEALDKPLF